MNKLKGRYDRLLAERLTNEKKTEKEIAQMMGVHLITYRKYKARHWVERVVFEEKPSN